MSDLCLIEFAEGLRLRFKLTIPSHVNQSYTGKLVLNLNATAFKTNSRCNSNLIGAVTCY